MGTLCEFKCPKCEYKTTVNGGIGYGMEAVVVTITCHDCHRLYDVVADQRADELLEAGAEKAPTGLVCPQNGEHRFEFWEAGGPCPRCGAAMEGGGLELMWD